MAGRPQVRFRPEDPSFVEDPYPVYTALRRDDPVHRGLFGTWVLTRWEDVVAALADTRLRNGLARRSALHPSRGGRYVGTEVAGNILPFMDGERHAALRPVIATAMRDTLKGSMPIVQGAVERLLEPHLAAGKMDLLHDFARPLALQVICELMGLPLADARRVEGWTGALLRLFQAIPSQRTLEGMERALGQFRDYLAAEVDARLQDPGPDLTSRLARDMEALDPFDRTCLIDNCMLLIADAVENVDAAISNALSALLRHPDQIELLQARPDLITPAVEECLRFEPPNQFIGRVAARDLTLRGREIREGSVVLLVLASANRDEARFENPDHFDIARKDTTHLGLGRGRHFCIGAQLVRMEMAAALGTVVRRLHDLELQDGALRWQARTGHRWLVDLPVTFAPA